MSDDAHRDDEVRRLARSVEANLAAHPDAETLVAHQRGELPEGEAAALEEHLAWCRDCASLYRDVPWFFEEEAEPAEPEDLAADWSALEARLAREKAPGPAEHPEPRRRVTAFRLMTSLAAALAVALGIAVYWIAQTHGRVDQLQQPRGNVPILDLAPEGAARARAEGPPAVSLERGAHLVFNTEAELGNGLYQAQILGEDGRLRKAIGDLQPTGYGNLTLWLPPGSLHPGLYRIVLRTEEGGPEVGHYALRVVESPGPPRSP